jgi:hypothetical protein
VTGVVAFTISGSTTRVSVPDGRLLAPDPRLAGGLLAAQQERGEDACTGDDDISRRIAGDLGVMTPP